MNPINSSRFSNAPAQQIDMRSKQLFRKIDADGDGSVSNGEFQEAIKKIGTRAIEVVKDVTAKATIVPEESTSPPKEKIDLYA